ncbi:MAG: glycosyltransferase family 39 protein, partial [Chloroflexota bacterium]|nr:glycosyltransferase family 39 protein [Chloroflexota bacterium]
MSGQPWRLKLLPPRKDPALPRLPLVSLPERGAAGTGSPTPPPARARLRLRLSRPRPAGWSRYTLGLLGVLGLGLLLRLPLLWAEPLDTPSAPQATMAAFVRRLAVNGGDLRAGLPWQGPLPLDVTAGLPLYAWLVALFSHWGGAQPWIGRAVTVAAALLATGLLFVVMRRLAGGRAAVYAALFLTLAPLGLYYGRAYLPDALAWAAAAAALAATLRWRDTLLADRPHKRAWAVMAAVCSGAALAVAPSNLALLPALLYLARPLPRSSLDPQAASRSPRPTLLFLAACLAPLLLWQVLIRSGGSSVELDPAFGGGGLAATLAGLEQGAFYGLLAGRLVNNTLTFAGFLLLLAGLGRSARQPWPWVCHLWLLGSLLGVLAQNVRLAADDSTLAPLLLPLAALVGLGANWLATLPAVIVAALRGHEEAPSDLDADAGDGTPPDESDAAPWIENRRPLRGAVRRTPSVASRRQANWPHTRTLLLRLG